MASKTNRRIVVDTSIMRSAGPPYQVVEVSARCRDFCMVLREQGHHVVVTAAILEEWKRHWSGQSRRWYTSMVARRQVFLSEPPSCINDTLRAKLDRLALTDHDREEMSKDTHLLEAAMASDNLIASLEQNVRRRFARASRKTGEMRHVVWVNPMREDEKPFQWLEEGAPLEPHRQLGNYLSE